MTRDHGAMAKILISQVDGLSAADVVHPTLTSTDAAATLGDLRAYFAASSSRRLAVLVDGDRFVGAITVEDVGRSDAPDDAPAREIARGEPTVAPGASAATARDLALATPSRRVPVVDDAGRLVGVVAIDKYLEGFCGAQYPE